MKILGIICLIFACHFTYGQNKPISCKYPFDQSADSLVKFVIKESNKAVNKSTNYNEIEKEFKSAYFKKHFYNNKLKVNYDSVFQVCINHLKENIGEKLFCENVVMYMNSFTVYESKRDFQLSFGFTYPVLKREAPIKLGIFDSYNEFINIDYKYSIDSNGKVKIVYPENIPQCAGKPDCGITITRERVYQILNFWGLIKENDKVYLTVNGMHWNITLTPDGWSFRHLSINIQTGELTNFWAANRID